MNIWYISTSGRKKIGENVIVFVLRDGIYRVFTKKCNLSFHYSIPTWSTETDQKLLTRFGRLVCGELSTALHNTGICLPNLATVILWTQVKNGFVKSEMTDCPRVCIFNHKHLHFFLFPQKTLWYGGIKLILEHFLYVSWNINYSGINKKCENIITCSCLSSDIHTCLNKFTSDQ